MRVFALLLVVGFAYAGRLDNTYLPPVSAKTSGGGQFLDTPFNEQSAQYDSPAIQTSQAIFPSQNFHDQPSTQYASPAIQTQQPIFQKSSSNYQQPSNQYGSPLVQNTQPTFQKSSQHFNGQPSTHNSFSSQTRPTFQKTSQNFHSSSSSYATPNNQQHSIPAPVYGPANFRSNNPEVRANTVRADNSNDGSGNYHFNYETENKISQTEQGQLKQVTDGEASVVQGSYSYPGDDGKVYTVNYIADENGFQPVGEHIDQAISMAASDAAKSAAAEGQNGYNYNSQQGYSKNSYQGYSKNSYQGYSAQQPQTFKSYQGGFNTNQPGFNGNKQEFSQNEFGTHQQGGSNNQQDLSAHQGFNGPQTYTQQDANNQGYRY